MLAIPRLLRIPRLDEQMGPSPRRRIHGSRRPSVAFRAFWLLWPENDQTNCIATSNPDASPRGDSVLMRKPLAAWALAPVPFGWSSDSGRLTGRRTPPSEGCEKLSILTQSPSSPFFAARVKRVLER